MDASSIGAPYIIAPLLGTAAFGVYRAVSNVAAPARILTNPLRPSIASMSLDRLVTRRNAVALTLGSVALGGAAWGALRVVGALDTEIGTLSALAPLAFATGIFVASSTFGHVIYLIARTHCTPRALWYGRLAQSGFAVVLPVAAALTGGLTSAVWAFVSATVIGAFAWAVAVARAPRRDAREESTGPSR